jgi:two-component system response regulator RegX3
VEPEEVRQAVKTAWRQREQLIEKVRKEPQPRLLRSGPFAIDLEKHTATCGGEPLDLTSRELTLLIHLMQNAHRVVDPIELVEVVQGYCADSLNEARESIRWYIHRLRQKVEPYPSTPRHILNVRGVGYRFEA